MVNKDKDYSDKGYAKGTPKWAIFKWFDIRNHETNELYLRRLRVIQTPFFAFYIHWIYREDMDRHPHDHPWNFWSFILRGGYSERYHWAGITEWRHWGPFTLHRMKQRRYHSIITLDTPGTISLVFTGRRKSSWGFLVEGEHVDHLEYKKQFLDYV